MSAFLIYGDSSSAPLRHELPTSLPDPVAYLELDGQRHVFAGSLDIPRLTAMGEREGFSVTSFESLGLGDEMAAGKPLLAAIEACLVRGCAQAGVRSVRAPADFPLSAADTLRGAGIEIAADGEEFDARRRRKHPGEIEGIRRGQRAAEAALEAIREGLRAGGDVTVEELRDAARIAFIRHGAVPHELVVIAPGPQGADPHDQGSGPIAAGVPIVVDVFPRDIESGCWGDLTRTLCVGEPPEELVRWHRDVREAQRLATDAVRPGVSGEELNAIAMGHLAAQGYGTRQGGAEIEEGFTHYLGHGVGLELHEAPTLDHGGEVLVPGDVVTIEPGLYRSDFGGCRIEDIVLVTETGHEILTSAPYDLAP
jgi:Xaa-Pro aminopeptidase